MSGGNMTGKGRGLLTIAEVEELTRSDQLDTVVVAFVDLQGRLMGKRVTADFFLEDAASHGVEACDYLLAVDVDMTPLPGYRFTSWETGYGDFKLVPDISTLRLAPWLDKTALVLCDLVRVDRDEAIAVSPRQILKAQVQRAQAMGFDPMCGSELEFFLFKDSYEQAREKVYRGLVPHSDWIEDYHILQTSRDEYLIRQIRNGMVGAGIPVEFSKGEAGFGQHELNIRFSDAVSMADNHTIYKNGAKEIAAANGRSVTFMAKYTMADVGSSCHIHSSLWRDGVSVMADSDDPSEMSVTFKHYLAGQIAATRELSLLFAPYMNSYRRYVSGSWAPTAMAWGLDNRTCGFRVVGRGSAMRVESRVPGADANPYIAFAGVIAAGLYGIENQLPLPEVYVGNGYEATDVERIPSTLIEAIQLFENSDIAKATLGEEVHHHLLNTAVQEWETFNKTVTDWELMRGFERL